LPISFASCRAKLAGRRPPQAYTIAADALGRDSNFDPQNDPIVRVEAGRLRARCRIITPTAATTTRSSSICRAAVRAVFRANTARRRTLVRLVTWRGQ